MGLLKRAAGYIARLASAVVAGPPPADSGCECDELGEGLTSAARGGQMMPATISRPV